MTARFELYEDHSGQHAFCLRSDDGAVLASREGFASAADVRNGIESLQSIAAAAAILDRTRS